MTMTRKLCVLAIALALGIAGHARGTSQITRAVFGGGAIRGTSANHEVASTAGQDVVGEGTSATHGVQSGFWTGGHQTTGIADPAVPGGPAAPVLPAVFHAYPNVPNPFNPSTFIAYDVPAAAGRVRLGVYDTEGRLVRMLIDKLETPGQRRVEWDGRNQQGKSVSSGVYLYVFDAPGYRVTRKLVVLR
jgi:hypothetical protein